MEEISTDIYRAEKFWYGYYLKNGKIQGVILKGGGGWNWRNKDSRAEELAEWLSNVLGLYDYKYKENDAPIMDDYLLDPEEYPRK